MSLTEGKADSFHWKKGELIHITERRDGWFMLLTEGMAGSCYWQKEGLILMIQPYLG